MLFVFLLLLSCGEKSFNKGKGAEPEAPQNRDQGEAIKAETNGELIVGNSEIRAIYNKVEELGGKALVIGQTEEALKGFTKEFDDIEAELKKHTDPKDKKDVDFVISTITGSRAVIATALENIKIAANLAGDAAEEALEMKEEEKEKARLEAAQAKVIDLNLKITDLEGKLANANKDSKKDELDRLQEEKARLNEQLLAAVVIKERLEAASADITAKKEALANAEQALEQALQDANELEKLNGAISADDNRIIEINARIERISLNQDDLKRFTDKKTEWETKKLKNEEKYKEPKYLEKCARKIKEAEESIAAFEAKTKELEELNAELKTLEARVGTNRKSKEDLEERLAKDKTVSVKELEEEVRKAKEDVDASEASLNQITELSRKSLLSRKALEESHAEVARIEAELNAKQRLIDAQDDAEEKAKLIESITKDLQEAKEQLRKAETELEVLNTTKI